eukprot:748779-Hanusia_phi.AAC.4
MKDYENPPSFHLTSYSGRLTSPPPLSPSSLFLSSSSFQVRCSWICPNGAPTAGSYTDMQRSMNSSPPLCHRHCPLHCLVLSCPLNLSTSTTSFSSPHSMSGPPHSVQGSTRRSRLPLPGLSQRPRNHRAWKGACPSYALLLFSCFPYLLLFHRFDSSDSLASHAPWQVYVIGGIVDRTVQKGMSLTKWEKHSLEKTGGTKLAGQQVLRSARLPINENVSREVQASSSPAPLPFSSSSSTCSSLLSRSPPSSSQCCARAAAMCSTSTLSSTCWWSTREQETGSRRSRRPSRLFIPYGE